MKNRNLSRLRLATFAFIASLLSCFSLLFAGDDLVYHEEVISGLFDSPPDFSETKFVVDSKGRKHVFLLVREGFSSSEPYVWYHRPPNGEWFDFMRTETLDRLYDYEVIAAEDGSVWATFIGESVEFGEPRSLWTRRFANNSWSGLESHGPNNSSRDLSAAPLAGRGIAVAASTFSTPILYTINSPTESSQVIIPHTPGWSMQDIDIAVTASGNYAVTFWRATFVSPAGPTRTIELHYNLFTPGSTTPLFSSIVRSATEPSPPPGTGSPVSYCSIATTPSGTPFISYWDHISNDLTIATEAWGIWIPSVVAASTAQTRQQQVFFDELGRLSLYFQNSFASPRVATQEGGDFDCVQILSGPVNEDHFDYALDQAGYLHHLRYGPGPGADLFVFNTPLDLTDLDGDGLPYAVEQVLRRDPNTAEHPSVDLNFQINNQNRPTVDFFTLSDTGKVPGEDVIFLSPSTRLRSEVQASGDLINWTTSVDLFDSDLFTVSGRGKLITVAQSPTIDQPTSLQFMRLKVVRERHTLD